MGTGYVRADTANNISNGNVIDADDLDNEFNAVEAAFNASTGGIHHIEGVIACAITNRLRHDLSRDVCIVGQQREFLNLLRSSE